MAIDIPAEIASDMTVENNLINEVGRLIITNERYQNDDWAVIAIVFDFVGGRESEFGYYFRADKSWKPETTKGFACLDKMLELQAVMEKRTGKKWLRALVHIDRAKQDINITFEYDDPKRWEIKPGNLEESVNALRP